MTTEPEDNGAPEPAAWKRGRGRSKPGPGSIRQDPKFLFYSFFGQQYRLPFVEGISGTKERILMSASILFAQRGYTPVSIRDIARANGVKPSSLYNHFESKEALWAAALEHIKKLYFHYFDLLEQALNQVNTFKEVLELILHEPKRLTNHFIFYGLSLVTQERINDPLAAEVFHAMKSYNLNFMREKFEACVARGWVRPFDAQAVAALIMNSTTLGVTVKVQEYEGRPIIYRTEEMIGGLERFILWATGVKPDS